MTHFYTSRSLETSVRAIAVSSLGNLFKAYPDMLLLKESREIMHDIFSGDQVAFKRGLLKIMHELIKEDEKDVGVKVKKTSSSKAIDMKILVGSSEEMGKSNISSSIMQMFLPDILQCILSPISEIVTLSFEIISIVLSQGLAHPIICIPALVAIETHPNVELRNKACSLHTYLEEKHSSFIHSKMMESVRFAYNFQRIQQASSTAGNSIKGIL
jgi:hypothetical protein